MNFTKLMIIDDSRVSRMMFIKFLEDTPLKFDVCEADCADQALQHFAENSDIRNFVVDFNMPGLNGLELIEKLQEKISDGKYNLLTANIQPDIHVRAEKMGVKVTAKPINHEKVIEIIKGFQK